MEDKQAPVQPEKPIHESHEHASKQNVFLRKPLFAILVALSILFLLGSLLLFKNSAPTTPKQSTPTVAAPQPRTILNTSEWKTYTNTEAGFSFRYPVSVILNGPPNETKQVLSITVDKVASLPEELPLSMGRIDAMKEKASLEKGEGENLVRIGSLNGQTATILSQFEVCSVLFTRQLTFFPGEYRVILTLAGPRKTIIADMPEFFTVDKENCGTEKVWNREKMSGFEPMLAKQEGRGMAQEWFDTFDALVKTVTLITPSKSLAPVWSTYKNTSYGFEISYPAPYRVLTDKDALSGYPNGVALLYTGGQAYDIVIEVWNTKAEYESNYSSRMSDVTVKESKGKFITFLDNTQSPENKQIIATIKLL